MKKIENTYSGLITELKDNQYFVFGSNTQGRHGKGAALIAREKFGAIYGQAKGFQGRSYAIITKDLTKKVHPSIREEVIVGQIAELYDIANFQRLLNKEFIMAWTGDGFNLNGYTSVEMAIMFLQATSISHGIPENIMFSRSIATLINNMLEGV